jgi:hypothetical protein
VDRCGKLQRIAATRTAKPTAIRIRAEALKHRLGEKNFVLQLFIVSKKATPERD